MSKAGDKIMKGLEEALSHAKGEDTGAIVHGACVNTDRDIWQERPGDFYSNRIFVTEGGSIGIDVGGHCIVMPVVQWHLLGVRYLEGDGE